MTLNDCSPFISGKTFTLKNSLEFSSKRLGVQFSSAVYESTKSTVSYNWPSRARFKCLHWFKNEAIFHMKAFAANSKKINLLLLFPHYSCRKEKSLDTIHANTSSDLIWSNGINIYLHPHQLMRYWSSRDFNQFCKCCSCSSHPLILHDLIYSIFTAKVYPSVANLVAGMLCM